MLTLRKAAGPLANRISLSQAPCRCRRVHNSSEQSSTSVMNTPHLPNPFETNFVDQVLVLTGRGKRRSDISKLPHGQGIHSLLKEQLAKLRAAKSEDVLPPRTVELIKIRRGAKKPAHVPRPAKVAKASPKDPASKHSTVKSEKFWQSGWGKDGNCHHKFHV
jgi:hypothetical protein